MNQGSPANRVFQIPQNINRVFSLILREIMLLLINNVHETILPLTRLNWRFKSAFVLSLILEKVNLKH